MDYIPKQATPSAPTKPTYQLVDDVTGLPVVKREPTTIKYITYDKDGKKKEIPFKVPFPPNENCKNCKGRGYVGMDIKSRRLIVCHKCYPLMSK